MSPEANVTSATSERAEALGQLALQQALASFLFGGLFGDFFIPPWQVCPVQGLRLLGL